MLKTCILSENHQMAIPVGAQRRPIKVYAIMAFCSELWFLVISVILCFKMEDYLWCETAHSGFSQTRHHIWLFAAEMPMVSSSSHLPRCKWKTEFTKIHVHTWTTPNICFNVQLTLVRAYPKLQLKSRFHKAVGDITAVTSIFDIAYSQRSLPKTLRLVWHP